MDSSRATTTKSNTATTEAGALQRACACGQHTAGGGTCATCQKQQAATLQRAATAASSPAIPPIVGQVLNSPGRPLDSSTRQFMETRFSHDFSSVRVHTDAQASVSAQAVQARAYTVGQDVVFRADQYAPDTLAGQHLLAHELSHVVQQASTHPGQELKLGSPGDAYEQDADRAANQVVNGNAGQMLALNHADGNTLRRVSFGNDGAFSPERKAIINQAAAIASQLIQTPAFEQSFNNFWRGPGKNINPKFSLAEYRAAVNGRIINNLDTSQQPNIKKFLTDDQKGTVLERQTAGVTAVKSSTSFFREFAVDQGIDSVVTLLLHESLHGAGATMGGPLMLYEPIFHSFEASVGFPMMMGGADIRMTDTAPSDPQIDIDIFYALHEIEPGSPLPPKIELQVVDQATGQKPSFKQTLPSKVGFGRATWQAKSPPPGVYSVRIVDVNTNTLMASHQLTITTPSPAQPTPTTPPVAPPQQPSPAKPGFFQRLKKWVFG